MLRKPIGKSYVGITQLDTKPIGKGEYVRRIPITIFYPSDVAGEMIPYLSGDNMRRIRDRKKVEDDIITYCYQDVSLSTKKKRYPVIIYSHGLNAYPMDNTVLCADLASHGYIIFSIGHPYGANMVRYTDNTYFDSWKEVIGENETVTVFNAISMLIKLLPFPTIKKKERVWEDYCAKYAKVQQKLVPLWEEDMITSMDYIEQVQKGEIPTRFAEKLDLSDGYSMIGMSLGGNVAVNTGIKDKRVSKIINIDGGLHTRIDMKDHNPPILVYCEKINRFSHLRLRALGYPKLTIEQQGGIEHWQYSDGVYLSDKGKNNPEWANRVSMEKAKACLRFLR